MLKKTFSWGWQRLRTASMLCGALVLASAQALAQTGGSYTTSWVGNSYGGKKLGWVMMDVKDAFVHRDGTMYAVTFWDEAAGNLMEFKAPASGTKAVRRQAIGADMMGAWQVAVTADDNFVYFGHRKHIARYNRSNLRQNGGDFGPVATGDFVSGLAVHNGSLYVSDRDGNRVLVYNTASMTQVASFPVPRPWKLTVGGDGNLWILQYGSGDTGISPGVGAKVVRYSTNGVKLPGEITDLIQPTEIATDNVGGIIVADSAPSRNHLRIYTPLDKPTAQSTFGQGIMTATPGEVKPNKFDWIMGAGADADGNYYVAWNGGPPQGEVASDAQGAVIRSLNSNGTLRWEALGLQFIDVADADPADDTNVFSKNERFVMDYSKPPGQQWTWAGYTLNRGAYPNDPRLHKKHIHMSAVQNIDGKRFMVTEDQWLAWTTIYRFDGEVAVPALMFMRDSGRSFPPHRPSGYAIWRDNNGNGQFDPGEYRNWPMGPHWHLVNMDSAGNLWHGFTNTLITWKWNGVDANGVPNYNLDSPTLKSIATDFTSLHAIESDPRTDSIYVAGYTKDYPHQGDYKPSGRVMAKYSNVSTQPKEVWRKTRADAPGQVINGFAQEGDYVFASDSRSGKIMAHRADNGDLVQTFTPGPEVDGATGWHDITQSIRVHKRNNGQYLVFAEEDLYAKVLMYQWTPPGGAPTPPTALANPSFEQPAVASLVYAPANAGWTFTGTSAIQRNRSAFNGALAPDGVQTAALQGIKQYAQSPGAMSQSVNLAAGSYTLSFKAARLRGEIQPLRFSVNGAPVGAPITPSGNGFVDYTTAPFTVSTAGAYTLSLQATDVSGHRTTLVDAVKLVRAGAR